MATPCSLNRMTTIKRILLVVAKAPAPGQTKTRLAGLLGAESAAAFYRCLLGDTLAIARQAAAALPGLTPAIAFWPPDGEAYFRALAPEFELILQDGETLGARLNHVINTALARGYQQAAVLSSDTPFVSPQALVDGFLALTGGFDAALGPCDDGGYYVLHVSAPRPELLLPITMSTPTVTQDTLAAAAAANLRVKLLPATQDIDVPDDIARTLQVMSDGNALPSRIAQHTRAWLADWSRAQKPS
jgi:uncharacterized protein